MFWRTVPEQYAGLRLDYFFDVVVFERLRRVGAIGPHFLIHTYLVVAFLLFFCTNDQKAKLAPEVMNKNAIPPAGSDLKATRRIPFFVIDGQNVFISCVELCNLEVIATKTDGSGGVNDLTLFLVESDREGFNRERNLEKLT